MRRFCLLVLTLCTGLTGAIGSAAQQATEGHSVELVLSGPSAMPLLRKGTGVTFHAVLINRSDSPFIFVPPHKEWPEERQLEWQAVDTKGRWLDRLPNYFIWCDVHGVMRAERRDLIQVIGGPAKQILDGDVVILHPGERYEIAGLADPSFALKILRRGVYQISLSYTLDSSRYALPKTSKNAGTLKAAGFLSFTSNTLAVRIN